MPDQLDDPLPDKPDGETAEPEAGRKRADNGTASPQMSAEAYFDNIKRQLRLAQRLRSGEYD